MKHGGAGQIGGARGGLRGVALMLALAAGLALSGCSSSQKLLGDLLGDTDNEVLPGKRESVLGPGGAAGAAAVASQPVAIPAAVTNASWPQPGGKLSNANHNLALGRPLKKVFTISAASSSGGNLSAPPIVIGGRVYVLGSDGRVGAFSATSGGRAWMVSLAPKGEDDGGHGGGLCSDGRALYAATGFGEVVALALSNGAQLWRRKLTMPVRAAPVVAGGRIYVRDSGNTLYAISASDGSILWTHQGDAGSTALIAPSAPAVASGYVVAPFTSGTLVAFSPQGYSMWSQSLSGVGAIHDIAARPVIDGSLVFAASATGSLAAFRLRDGEETWSRELGGRNTPWVAGDYLFHIAGRRQLVAVEKNTGAIRWSTSLPGGSWSGPVMGGGRLLAVSSKGVLAEISPQSGQIMHKTDIGDGSHVQPVIAAGMLYILDDDGRLHAFR